MPGLIVLPFRHGPFWNFSYVIACPETREAAIIDPAWDPAAILRACSAHAFDVRSVILTHTHSDHINGLAEVVEATTARIVVHSGDAAALASGYGTLTDEVSRDELFHVGNVRLELLHTPGHSPGSMAIFGEGHLFSGDTLHVGGVGRPGPELESLEALWESLRVKLAPLPDATILHPGHDEGPSPTATLGEERQRVGALTVESFDAFVLELERSTGRILR